MNTRTQSPEPVSAEPSAIFWRTQAAVWVLLAVVGFCIRLVIFGNALAAFWLTLALEPLAFLFTSIAAIAHARHAARFPFLVVFACATVMCFAVAALLPAIGNLIHTFFPPGSLKGIAEAQYRLGFVYYLGIFSIWTLIYFGVNAELTARNERISKMRAETRAVQLELEHLQRQVEPHFLFNSLNAVVAEIAERPAVAEELTRRLADYLRYSLDRRERGMCRLDEELEAVEAYIRIQALRFDERLEYRSRVEPDALQARLPHMTLQGLVENAIKHGMRADHSCFEIVIDVHYGGDRLVVEVSHPGRLRAPREARSESREGGLGNLSRRLALYYPGRHEFSLSQQSNRTVARLSVKGLPVSPFEDTISF